MSDFDRAAEALPPAAITADEVSTLPRVLGLFDAVTLVVGGIIGSGIFFKAKVLAGNVGGFGELTFGPIMAVWAILGLHTLFASLSLAELAAMMPQAGGPYVYLREAYGRPVAFLWGWTEFWVVRTASLGALACATVMSLAEVVPMSRLAQESLAIGLVLALSAVNFVGTRWGAAVQNVTTVVKVGFLAAIVVVPLLMRRGSPSNFHPIAPESMSLDFWRAMGVAAVAVLWPYDGWINIAPVAEEIRDPQRNVPRALTVGILLILAVYLGANISYQLVLTKSQIAAAENGVAAELFRALFGPVGASVAALGVMCSTFGAVNSNLITGPRIYFAMARDGLLPQALRRIHGTFQTPSNAIVLQAVWSIALIVVAFAWKSKPDDAFDALTDFAIFGGLVFYALVVASVIVLRMKRPELSRPYRTWGYPVTPILYLAGSSGVMVSMLFDKWQQTAAGTFLIVAGLGYYLLARHLGGVGGDQG